MRTPPGGLVLGWLALAACGRSESGSPTPQARGERDLYVPPGMVATRAEETGAPPPPAAAPCEAILGRPRGADESPQRIEWWKSIPANAAALASSGLPCTEPALWASLPYLWPGQSKKKEATLRSTAARVAVLAAFGEAGGTKTLVRLDEWTTDTAARDAARDRIWERFAARARPAMASPRRIAVSLSIRAYRPVRLDIASLLDEQLRAAGIDPQPAHAGDVDGALELEYTETSGAQFTIGFGTYAMLEGYYLDLHDRRLAKVDVRGASSEGQVNVNDVSGELHESALAAFRSNLPSLAAQVTAASPPSPGR